MTKSSDDNPRGYDIGFGRPPKHTRFKPGQSGNPNGRPRGKPTVAEVFDREGRRTVKAKIGSKVEDITKIEALARKVLQKAIEGDIGAARLVVQMVTPEANSSVIGESIAETLFGDTAQDKETLTRMLDRFKHFQNQE